MMLKKPLLLLKMTMLEKIKIVRLEILRQVKNEPFLKMIVVNDCALCVIS